MVTEKYGIDVLEVNFYLCNNLQSLTLMKQSLW